jgi:uncharacterized protein (DUF58 family)
MQWWLFSALARALNATRSSHRWLRRRFTVVGGCLLIGLVVSLGTATPEQTAGLGVFILLLGLLIVAIAYTPFFRGSFAIERQVPRLATAGEAFPLRVVIRNHGRRLQRGLTYGEIFRPAPITGRDLWHSLSLLFRRSQRPDARSRYRTPRARPVDVPPIPAGGAVEIDVWLTVWRRGTVRLTGGRLGRTDPFGIFRAFVQIPAVQTVLILPPRFPLPHLELPGSSQYQPGGVAMAAGIGEAEEFTALRDYRPGDPLKHVHWRSAARTGRLVVKEFQDESFARHGLVLDTFCAPDGDDRFEEAVAVAASFACTIPDQESLLDLLFVGPTPQDPQAAPQAVCVTSGRGVGHAQQMLEVLAGAAPSRDPSLGALETLILAHQPTLSGCILVLLAWDGPRRALVRQLKGLGLPLLVLLIVPPGKTADFSPGGKARGEAADQPDRLIVLESGRVGLDLLRLAAN